LHVVRRHVSTMHWK